MSPGVWTLVVTWVIGIFVGTVVVTTIAVVGSAGSDDLGAIHSHDILEADRLMTARMAIEVGPGMEAQMIDWGMLDRSTSPGYLEALRRHSYEFDRSIGLVP